MMAVARRLSEGEALARSGNWKNWDLDQLVGTDVWGKTLGIVGFGRIGRAVARRASGFQMKVIYTDAVRAAEGVEKELKAEFRDMNALLAESDFVSAHVPLLPETRGLFDAPKFHRMKPTAFLINTSRGPVVDEAALVAALEAKKIAGAGLDVYENEPFIHPGLKRPNVVLAPHIASASLETRTKMACMAAENVVALFKGQRPPNILNPEVLKANSSAWRTSHGGPETACPPDFPGNAGGHRYFRGDGTQTARRRLDAALRGHCGSAARLLPNSRGGHRQSGACNAGRLARFAASGNRVSGYRVRASTAQPFCAGCAVFCRRASDPECGEPAGCRGYTFAADDARWGGSWICADALPRF